MIDYHRIAARMFNRPLLLDDRSAETISTVILSEARARRGSAMQQDDGGSSKQYFQPTQRQDGTIEGHAPRASRFYGEYPVDDEDGNRRPAPYRRTAEGIAIITTVGELVNRGAWVGASSGLVSYEAIKYQFMRAAADPKTRAIIHDIESPGGEGIGCFEAAECIRKVAAEKPVHAVVNGMACSAGYALASGATRVVTMPTGESGHIGVLMLHLDWSKALESRGIKPTWIFSGKHKVDGNQLEPLPADVKAAMQADCDLFYAKFVATVAAGRKQLSEDEVRATEAQIYIGEEAVAAKLADAIGTFEEVLAELSRAPAGRSFSSNARSAKMDNQTGAPDANAPAGTVTQAEHDRQLAATRETAVAEGRSAGETAAATRIAAILDHPEASGREQLARHLAFKTKMSAEDAAATLGASPKATEASSKPSLTDRMSTEPQPGLGAPPASGPGTQDPRERGKLIVMRAKGKTA